MSPSIILIVGTRPNLVKAAALVDAHRASGCTWALELVHTGQHYDDRLSRRFVEQLALDAPVVNLNVGAGSITQQTAWISERLEPVLASRRPRFVVVLGDVTSTLAGALTAKRLGIGVAHVEAGLRSFDREMPEEVNRVLTDAISDVLFATEPSALDNLRREGIDAGRVHFVGNPMIDTLLRHEAASRAIDMPGRLGLVRGEYVLVTLHRPSNVDRPERLAHIVHALSDLARDRDVVFPVHPRTAVRLDEAGLTERLRARVRILEPQPYLEFIGLTTDAGAVLTDSGGIQEETTALGVPCITMRTSTERPITVTNGTNVLVGDDPGIAVARTRSLLRYPRIAHTQARPEHWDGCAGIRIVSTLDRLMAPPATLLEQRELQRTAVLVGGRA